MAAPQVENKGENGHIRDMFSKQFTAVKKTKNRNILYKCTYNIFYVTTHYIYAATWLIGNNLQYTLTISKLLFFQQSFMFHSVPTKIISWLHNFKSLDWKIGLEKKNKFASPPAYQTKNMEDSTWKLHFHAT